MNFGEHLYNLRKERNISQGELADALNVSRQSVSKWENNVSTPELDKIIKMAEIFGISVDELLNGKNTAIENHQKEPQIKVDQESRISKKAKSIISLILLCAGAIILTLTSIFIGFLNGISVALPFFICSAVCFWGKRDILLRCVWVVYIFLEFYVFDATGVAGNLILQTFTGMIANPWHIVFAWIMLAAMITMAVITIYVYYKRPLTVKLKHLIIFIGFFALFRLILPIITQALYTRAIANNVTLTLLGVYNFIIYICNRAEYIFTVIILCYLARIIYPRIE